MHYPTFAKICRIGNYLVFISLKATIIIVCSSVYHQKKRNELSFLMFRFRCFLRFSFLFLLLLSLCAFLAIYFLYIPFIFVLFRFCFLLCLSLNNCMCQWYSIGRWIGKKEAFFKVHNGKRIFMLTVRHTRLKVVIT